MKQKKSTSPKHLEKHPLLVKQTLKLYLQATARHKRYAYLALLVPLGNVLLGVVIPFFASKVLADIASDNHAISHHFTWLIVSAVLAIFVNLVGIRNSMKLQAVVMEDLHDTMFANLLGRSVGFYNNQIGGKLVGDAIAFVSSYGQLINAGLATGLGFLATTIVGLILVFFSSWVIGLTVTCLLFGLAFWTYIETLKRSGLRNERLVISQRLTAHLSDNIVNAVTVKTFAQEDHETADNRKISANLAQVRISDWLHVVTNENQRMAVLLVMQIALVGVLIRLTQHNPHLLGAGIFAFTYTLTLVNRFFQINTLTRQIEDVFLQASPMTELLGQTTEIEDGRGAKPLIVKDGKIVCRGVTFHYADATSDDAVFKKLNLTIKPGQKVGLVGHSGGGKSTLTRLLLRFDDISGGSIAIDGQDIREVTQQSLRQHISYVPQEPLLFHRTIRDNIAYGKPDATDAEIIAVAKKAFAHDFIEQLPKGYKTMVGERGVKLSGGQRQRVAIARAMLKESSILILDEATSALDSESEKVIQEALWQLMEDKTAIVIAHRLSTIQRLDRIIVLDEGKIVEDGSHNELLKRKGQYARLWKHQSGGFIED